MSKPKEQAARGKGGKPQPGIFSLLKPYRRLLLLLVLLALVSNGVNLAIPGIIRHAMNSYQNGHLVLNQTLLWFSLAAVFIFVFTYLQSIVQTYASERVARDLRTRLAGKISGQDYAFIQQANPSKLLTNLTSDVDAIKMFVAQAIVSIVSSLFIIIGASILLMTINWKLASVVLLLIPIIGITFFVVLRKVRVLFKRSREIIDWLNKVINESILGSMLVRVINSQQLEYDKFLRANTDARDLGLTILRLFASLIPVIQFTANIAMLSILAMGGHFVITGHMQLGDFAAFNSYLVILIFPILVIGFMSNVIAQATASYQRIAGILDAADAVDTGVISAPLKGEVSVNNISLLYGGKYTLRDVSFHAAAGSKTAIIGPTAGGKTQLLNILAALAKPGAGTVQYDGHEIAEYNKQSLHSQLGLVFQDSIIFNMSIRENIAFNSSVTPEAMQKAIESAELGDFIRSLPQQLETVVSERGSTLSGGQKQRIMLARALAINPRILLLDDFTARVDTQTEQRILENVRRNYPGITLISVTQKIEAVTHYDQIILLMEGEVIATGTHEQLLSSCPEYIQIYQSQRSTSHYENVAG